MLQFCGTMGVLDGDDIATPGFAGDEHLNWTPASGARFSTNDASCRNDAEQLLPVLFVGVLANLSALKAKYQLPTTQALSNAQIVWHLYREYGHRSFADLNGHFSFAIWDGEQRTGLLTRDRFGLYTIYYSLIGNRVVFSRHYKTLLPLQKRLNPNVDAIAEFQHTGWVRRGHSFVQGIHSVESGTTSFFVDGRIAKHCALPMPDRRVFRRSPGELAREIVQQSHAAARRFAAIEDRHVGVALSSGIDSSYLLGLVKSAHPDSTVHSFSVGYGYDDPELVGALETAKLFGTTHHPIVVRPAELPQLLPETIWHLEDPVGRDQYPCVLKLSKEACKTVRRLYFGNGTDRMYGGTLPHRHQYWSKRLPVLRTLSQDYLTWLRSSHAPRGLASRLLLRALGIDEIPPPARARHSGFEMPRVVHKIEEAPEILRLQLLESVLENDGNHGMKHQLVNSSGGCEVRMPFCDEEMLAHSLTIEDREKFLLWIGKYQFRQASRELLPLSVAYRRKRIQHLRYDEEYSRVIDDLLDMTATREIVVNRGILDYDSVTRLRRRPGSRPYHGKHLYRLWYVIVTEIWARIFLDNRGRSWSALS
jgi:asparagine synthase (glutamine-hydrolysing)